MRLPDFVIIGAQKSATTFLHDALYRHPQIFIPRDEIPFFEDPFYGQGDPAALAGIFRDAPTAAVLGIKRPTYLGMPECPARIRKLLPNAKLLVVLRNPVDRAISSYFYLMRNYRLPVVEPNSGLGAILDGKSDGFSQRPLELGLYGKHLSRYLELFPREQMLVLQQEKLISRPEEELAKVLDMLGVDKKAMVVHPARSNPGMYHLGFLRARHRVRRLRFIRDEVTGEFRPRTGVFGAAVGLACTGATFTLRKTNDYFAGHIKPQISTETRGRLQAYFRDDIELTEKCTGLELSAWKAW